MKQDIKSVSFEQLYGINEVNVIISDEPLHTPFDFFSKIIMKDIVSSWLKKGTRPNM